LELERAQIRDSKLPENAQSAGVLPNAQSSTERRCKDLAEARLVPFGKVEEGQTVSDLRNKDGSDKRECDKRRWRTVA